MKIEIRIAAKMTLDEVKIIYTTTEQRIFNKKNP